MSKWKFSELSELCNLEKGKTGLLKAKEGKYTLVATGKNRRTCDTYQFDTKAVCIPLVSSTGHGHASLKYVHYEEGKFALGTILVAVIPKDENVLNAQFLHLYLSRLKDIILVPLMTGAANVTLTVTKLKTVKVPLPPIEEQLRIVSLFNSMDNEQAELTDEISNQQELLKKLRQSILQEAIEGKLTASWREQNPDVESASILLEKIKTEKEQLIKDKKIKKQKPLPPINEDEISFDIPDSWEWCRLGDIGEAKIGLTYKPSDISDNGTIVLRSSNIKNGKIDFKDLVKVKVNINDNKLTNIGDILICARNGSKHLVGKSALITEKGMSFGAFMSMFRSDFYNYIYMFLQSSIFRKQFDDEKSTGINQLTQGILRSIVIPFPPFKEQKEIVNKIKSLFKICDDLETKINSSKNNSETLMRAVLKEAFEND